MLTLLYNTIWKVGKAENDYYIIFLLSSHTIFTNMYVPLLKLLFRFVGTSGNFNHFLNIPRKFLSINVLISYQNHPYSLSFCKSKVYLS